MEELNNVPTGEVSPTGKFQKTWHYTEKNKKHTVNHTIILTKDRYTHQSEIKTVSHAMKSRTDLNVKNVHSVETFYGLSRNIGLAVLLFVIALAELVAAILCFKEDNNGIGVVFIIGFLIFLAIGIYILMRIKPAFMLQINTVIRGNIESNGVAYGGISAAMGATAKRGGIFGLIGNLFRSIFSFARPRYRFEMPPEVGNDIVDTIGALLIED